MIDRTKLFREIKVCSNRFVEGSYLLKVNGTVVLRLERGEYPNVWLSAAASTDGLTWQPVVEESRSLSKRVSVVFRPEQRSVQIVVNGTPVLTAVKISEDQAEIPEMDLSPIGINISGDRKGITIGTNRLTENTFTRVETMIDIGNDPSRRGETLTER